MPEIPAWYRSLRRAAPAAEARDKLWVLCL